MAPIVDDGHRQHVAAWLRWFLGTACSWHSSLDICFILMDTGTVEYEGRPILSCSFWIFSLWAPSLLTLGVRVIDVHVASFIPFHAHPKVHLSHTYVTLRYVISNGDWPCGDVPAGPPKTCRPPTRMWFECLLCMWQYKPSKFASNKTMQTKTCSAIVVALLFLSLLSIFMGNLNLCFGPHPPRAAVESQLNAMKGALWGSCGTVQLELLAAVLCAAFTTARRWWVHSEIWDLNESLYHSHPARLYPPKQGGKSAGSKWSLALFHLLDYEAPVVAGLGR